MSLWRPYLYLRLLRYLSAEAVSLQVSTIQVSDERASSSSLPRHLDDLACTIHTYLKHPWQSLNCLIRHCDWLPYYLCLNHCRNHGYCCVLNWSYPVAY